MLLPRPGFPIYETFANYYGVECRHTDLLPERDWEVDLDQVALLVDENTAAWIICNPSNPCGSVYNHRHLAKIAAVAERLRVPIISDEIYAHLVFGDTEFTPMATFSFEVPVLTVGGISKRWLAPGWRLGWIIVRAPKGILTTARVRVLHLIILPLHSIETTSDKGMSNWMPLAATLIILSEPASITTSPSCDKIVPPQLSFRSSLGLL